MPTPEYRGVRAALGAGDEQVDVVLAQAATSPARLPSDVEVVADTEIILAAVRRGELVGLRESNSNERAQRPLDREHLEEIA